MTIHSLTIENLRGFAGKHEIVFEDRNVAAFIGVNGSGKSTVLEAIVSSLQTLVSFSKDRDELPWYIFNRLDVTNGHTEASWRVEMNGPEGKEGLYRISVRLSNEYEATIGPVTGYGGNEMALQKWLSSAIFDAKQKIPVMAYYRGTKLNTQEYNFDDRDPRFLDRRQAYMGAFNVSVDYNSIANYYNHIVNIQNGEAIRRKDIYYRSPSVIAYEEGVGEFLSVLNGGEAIGKIELSYEANQQIIVYRKKEQTLLLSQLSAGEKAVIGLAMDLIYRCVAANGHLPAPLHSEGIVLIDEIELHLHPRWQANIIKALTTTFPNIQFIISTHAPLVINQLKDNQVFALRKDGITPGTRMQETYGMDASAVITNIMGAPSRPPEVSKRLDEVAKLLDDPTPENLNQVQDKLNALKKIISPNDLELIQLSNILSIEESAVDL